MKKKKNRGHVAIMGDVYRLMNSSAYKKASPKVKDQKLWPLFEEYQESEKRRIASIERSERLARKKASR